MNHTLRVRQRKAQAQWALSNAGTMMYFDLISLIKYRFLICKITEVLFYEGIVSYSLIHSGHIFVHLRNYNICSVVKKITELQYEKKTAHWVHAGAGAVAGAVSRDTSHSLQCSCALSLWEKYLCRK